LIHAKARRRKDVALCHRVIIINGEVGRALLYAAACECSIFAPSRLRVNNFFF
jgi:hypothetical protein